MLVGAAVLAPQAPEVAHIWLACSVIANAFGLFLWGHRDRLPPYPALQALMLALGIIGWIALVALHLFRPGLRINFPPGVHLADEPRSMLYLLIVVAGVMTRLHFMELSAKKQRSQSEQ